jgi:hypothetical protein
MKIYINKPKHIAQFNCSLGAKHGVNLEVFKF